jgi:hypothetical protein
MARSWYWLSGGEWARIGPHLPKRTPRRSARGRSAGDLGDRPHAQDRGALARLPAGVRAVHDGLQPLRSVVEAGRVGGCVLPADRLARRGGNHRRRQHTCQGAPLGGRRARPTT